jgi:undecaprenyl-diphosphatase
MSWFEALILGIIQGLTEFLPISSSGHLEIGKVLLDSGVEKSMTFTVVVHGATVLSILFVFWKDIYKLIKEVFSFRWSSSNQYTAKLLLSMLPVLVVGLFFKEDVESLFTGNLVLVGSMLLVTALLLAFTYFFKAKERKVNFFHSFIIGISQAFAVLPGISRSGATISTALLLGVKREEATRFSFLMVIIPILGANFKDLADKDFSSGVEISILPLAIGFLAAFLSGLFACKWMIKIVNRGNLIYFVFYCLIIGLLAIFLGH